MEQQCYYELTINILKPYCKVTKFMYHWSLFVTIFLEIYYISIQITIITSEIWILNNTPLVLVGT